MPRNLKLGALAFATALSFSSAMAQSTAQPPGSAGTGSSATGAGSAPMAQSGGGTGNAPKEDKVGRDDRQFIQKAAGSGMFEVQAAQLAKTKARDPSLKSFAGMLEDHHAKANDELMKLATAKGVEVGAAPPRALRREVAQLGKKEGQEFDQAYLRDVGIKAHEKDIKLFEKASKDAKDPEVKAWAGKTLPVLKEHLAQARKMEAGGKGSRDDASKMGNTGSKPAGTPKTAN